LAWQVDRIISVAKISDAIAILFAGYRVRAGGQHLVDHVPAPAKQA